MLHQISADNRHQQCTVPTVKTRSIYKGWTPTLRAPTALSLELCEEGKSRDVPQQAREQELSVNCAYKELNSIFQESNPHTAIANKVWDNLNPVFYTSGLCQGGNFVDIY